MRLSPRLTTAAALSALAVSLLVLPQIAAGLLPRLETSSAEAASLPDPATGFSLAAGPRATAVLAGVASGAWRRCSSMSKVSPKW